MNIKYLGRLVDGKKNGDGREFHSNGNPYYDGNYQNNQPHGDKLTIFHPNKQAWYSGSMEEGQKQGHGTEFYENGQILYSGNWHQNEPHGENVKIHNSDGSVMFEGRKLPDEELTVSVEVTPEVQVEVTTVSEETTVTVTEGDVTTVNVVENEQGTTTTTEIVTTEIVGINEETGNELVKVTDTTQVVKEDGTHHVYEVDNQVVVEVDLVNIQTGELVEVEVKDTTFEVVIPCESGFDVAQTETVEVLHHTEDGQVHVDVVTTTEVDHVNVETGELTVTEQETTTECVAEHQIVSETVEQHVEGGEVVTETTTEVVTEAPNGDVTVEVTVTETHVE
jgi:hypothetical protein